MFSNLDLQHLQTFLVVAEEMNFGRAAERLHIAQPPLSRQIQRLEKNLGVELFNRSKPQIQLTSAGKVFVREATKILKQVDLGVQLTQRASRGEIGKLAIAFEGSSLSDLVPRSIQSFRQQFPEVEILIQEMPTKQQIQALLEERIDLGFIVPQQQLDNLMSEIILEESLVVAIAKDHPLASQEKIEIGQLQQESFLVGFNDGSCGLDRTVIQVCQQAGFEPKLMSVTNEMQLILGFISTGMGVALLPNSIRNIQRKGVVYLPLQSSTVTSSLAIAWREDTPCSTLDNFLNIVRTKK
ncbi:LysR family transcriptional regulator [Stanieria sp. NIES-3757]|nr:LysR family transcriptional regulator [Stanieria sp. NIES-3757]